MVRCSNPLCHKVLQKWRQIFNKDKPYCSEACINDHKLQDEAITYAAAPFHAAVYRSKKWYDRG